MTPSNETNQIKNTTPSNFANRTGMLLKRYEVSMASHNEQRRVYEWTMIV